MHEQGSKKKSDSASSKASTPVKDGEGCKKNKEECESHPGEKKEEGSKKNGKDERKDDEEEEVEQRKSPKSAKKQKVEPKVR